MSSLPRFGVRFVVVVEVWPRVCGAGEVRVFGQVDVPVTEKRVKTNPMSHYRSLWRVTQEGWPYDKAYTEMRRYWFGPKFVNLSGAVRERAEVKNWIFCR